ncbi:hypothetical protein ABVT39_018643 [Epinephelus coioides]
MDEVALDSHAKGLFIQKRYWIKSDENMQDIPQYGKTSMHMVSECDQCQMVGKPLVIDAKLESIKVGKLMFGVWMCLTGYFSCVGGAWGTVVCDADFAFFFETVTGQEKSAGGLIGRGDWRQLATVSSPLKPALLETGCLFPPGTMLR